MLTALKAGLSYFAVMFSAGFAFGTVRELLVRPVIGNDLARLAELPVMLVLAWLVCGWLVLRLDVAANAGSRIVMGALMFTLAMIAEAMVGQFIMGLAFPDQIRLLSSAVGMSGLVAQMATATFPYVRMKQGHKS